MASFSMWAAVAVIAIAVFLNERHKRDLAYEEHRKALEMGRPLPALAGESTSSGLDNLRLSGATGVAIAVPICAIAGAVGATGIAQAMSDTGARVTLSIVAWIASGV